VFNESEKCSSEASERKSYETVEDFGKIYFLMA
jgi:hypothetical protein